jgi:hypothetical protein
VGEWEGGAGFVEYPGFGFIAHRDELTEDAVAEPVNLTGLWDGRVTALNRMFEPGLGFGGFTFSLV